jgi:integrase
MLLNSGVGMEVVSKVLGHSTTRITRQIYAKLLDETVADEMSKML